jgi:hypothetical protein
VKFELAMIAVIAGCLLMLVVSCQNREKPFQDSMKRWREHRQQKKQNNDEERRIVPDDIEQEDERRRRHRRRIFTREGMSCDLSDTWC